MKSPPPLAVTTLSSGSSSPALSVFDDEGYQEGQELPAPPVPVQAKPTKSKAEGPRVVYVGHIPHGFYEHQMRAYFSQFGTINRLRLSRNRKTGASKHYAFIEFASAEVASIVASTMNSYLLFGHILRCKVMPPEQVHEKLWVGANRRFKVVPWSRIEGRKLNLPMGREAWERRVETEKKRRAKKNRGLEKIGYEGPVGGLRQVADLPIRQEELNHSPEEPALELGDSAGEAVPKETTGEEKDANHTNKGSASEPQTSKRKADTVKVSGAKKKVRRETQPPEALKPIGKDSASEPRTSKRKSDNDQVSAAKKARRKKSRSDKELESG